MLAADRVRQRRRRGRRRQLVGDGGAGHHRRRRSGRRPDRGAGRLMALADVKGPRRGLLNLGVAPRRPTASTATASTPPVRSNCATPSANANATNGLRPPGRGRNSPGDRHPPTQGRRTCRCWEAGIPSIANLGVGGVDFQSPAAYPITLPARPDTRSPWAAGTSEIGGDEVGRGLRRHRGGQQPPAPLAWASPTAAARWPTRRPWPQHPDLSTAVAASSDGSGGRHRATTADAPPASWWPPARPAPTST